LSGFITITKGVKIVGRIGKKRFERRREEVSLCLAQSMTKPQIIAEVVEKRTSIPCKAKDVTNDIAYFRRESQGWPSSLAIQGYVYECSLAVEKVNVLERRMQELLEKSDNADQKVRITHEIEELINLKLSILENGPNLLILRQLENKEKTCDTQSEEPSQSQ